jgi:hypothetical protein
MGFDIARISTQGIHTFEANKPEAKAWLDHNNPGPLNMRSASGQTENSLFTRRAWVAGFKVQPIDVDPATEG